MADLSATETAFSCPIMAVIPTGSRLGSQGSPRAVRPQHAPQQGWWPPTRAPQMWSCHRDENAFVKEAFFVVFTLCSAASFASSCRGFLPICFCVAFSAFAELHKHVPQATGQHFKSSAYCESPQYFFTPGRPARGWQEYDPQPGVFTKHVLSSLQLTGEAVFGADAAAFADFLPAHISQVAGQHFKSSAYCESAQYFFTFAHEYDPQPGVFTKQLLSSTHLPGE